MKTLADGLSDLLSERIDGMTEAEVKGALVQLALGHPYLVRTAISDATGREVMVPDELDRAETYRYICDNGLAESMLTAGEDTSNLDEETRQHHLGIWRDQIRNWDVETRVFGAIAREQVKLWENAG